MHYVIRNYIEARKQISQRIRNLDEESYNTRLEQQFYNASANNKDIKKLPFIERVIVPFKKWLERTTAKITPAELKGVIQHRLVVAGKYPKWSVEGFAVVVLIVASLTGYIGFDMAQKKDMIFIQRVIACILGIIIGGLVPFSVLNIMMQKRQKMILKQMPEVLDLLCVSVQAGLTFDAAMRKIVDRMQGPLIDECRRMLNDVRMGMVRRQALRLLAERCDIQDVSLFTTAIIQSERLGTSMATTLNNQAENMRERRRQYIKAEALKAPIKIVFPLVIFIFPALFVVVLLPAILSLADSPIVGK